MNCKDLEKFKDKYLHGNITDEEERQLEQHLENCSYCQGVLDSWLEENEQHSKIANSKKNSTKPAPLFDEARQRNILRWAKYKSRFSIALFLLALFVFAQIAGTLVSSLLFNLGGENARYFTAQKTAGLLTEFTLPNVTVPSTMARPLPAFTQRVGFGDGGIEVKPYFAIRGSYSMEKKIGKERYTIGHLNVNQFLTSTQTKWDWKDGSYEHYLYFYHPDQLKEINPYYESGTTIFADETWQALENLPEGIVAELAFSFTETYTLDQVWEILDMDIDMEITWYAVSTGLEGQSYRGRRQEIQEPLSAFRGVWGFSNISSHMFAINNTIRLDDSSIREQYFIQSIKYLLENEPLAQKIYRGHEELRLAERYEYLQENGVKIYGVVVTGPVKELLKLRELENIHSPALGDIKLWNWFHRSFSGRMY